MTVNIAELQARLTNGTFSDADLDTAGEIVKGLQSGSLDANSLPGLPDLLKSMGVEPPAPKAAPQAAPEPVEDDPAESPAQMPTPEPDELRKALGQNPDSRRAINAVPALQAMVGSFELIAEAQAELAKSLAELTGEVLGLKKSLAMHQPYQPPLPNGNGNGNHQDLLKSIGADTSRALSEAIAASVGADIRQLKDAVFNRPWSENSPTPPPGHFQKSLGGQDELSMADAIGLIQKSMDMGRITEDQGTNALSHLDMARKMNVTLADVIRKVDPKTLNEFAPGV